jgi:hypothetical protein
LSLPRTTRTARRSAAAVIAALALGLVPITVVAEPAAAAPGATVMITTQRMSQATLTSAQAGWYTKGSRLTLSCYQRGQNVRGYFSPWMPNGGWSNLWYRVSDGYYVADVDIDTGSNNPVTGPCAPAPVVVPAPASGLAAKVDAFVTRYTNKYVDYDGRFGAQCVDLFNFYNRDVIGAGFVSVDLAWQLYAAAPTAKYDKLPANATPRKGDVAIWASNKPASKGGGHVAIVLSVPSAGSITVFEQNAQGSPSVVRTESTAYLTGYLRPRG